MIMRFAIMTEHPIVFLAMNNFAIALFRTLRIPRQQSGGLVSVNIYSMRSVLMASKPMVGNAYMGRTYSFMMDVRVRRCVMSIRTATFKPFIISRMSMSLVVRALLHSVVLVIQEPRIHR